MDLFDPPPEWVVCLTGHGHRIRDGQRDPGPSTFRPRTVGLVLSREGYWVRVQLGQYGELWDVDPNEVETIDVIGPEWAHESHPDRICSSCFRHLPNEAFDKDNPRADGTPQRRPDCRECKQAVAKRPKRLPREIEATRPAKGSPFTCPCCRRFYIAGVNTRITADHDHDTGAFRDWICGDRCNAGMGRFRNGIDGMLAAVDYLKRHGAVK